MIDIIADEADLIEEVHLLERLQEDRVPGAVVAQQVNQGKAFRGAILQMPHVHVSPPAVEQKSSVARRFIPIALVHVRQPKSVLLKNPVADPAHSAGRTGRVVGQTTELRFEADNPVHKPNWARVSSS